ncbi:MAG: M48 family metallopeptidase [Chloroflexi bacterium]|jgi:predicted metal-dependent hydrolase|nr:M48 family metallopeptidase [Chloroflexota bacterium]
MTGAPTPTDGDPSRLPVRVITSERRTRTLSARVVGDTLEVRVPVDAPTDLVNRFVSRVRRKELARRALGDDATAIAGRDADLHRRALELNRRYLDGTAVPARVRYVTNQDGRYGSCSVRSREIRISHRLAAMPAWVRDYVLIHELAHLRVAGHGRAFWRLVERYPLTERARGYLMGAGLAPASDGDEDGVADDVDGGAGFDIVVDVAGDGGTTGVPGT